jgi:hypothetical protein
MFPRKKESVLTVNNINSISNSNGMAKPIRKTIDSPEEIEQLQHIKLQPSASE